MATPRICSIPDCGKPIAARGWCRRHYDRWRSHGDPLAGGTIQGKPLQFLAKVLSSKALGTDCIHWPYALTEKGYGTVTVKGRTVRVHRYVCLLTHGAAPTSKHEAAHACGVRNCINPRHLRWATHHENILDKALHGTDRGWHRIDEKHSRGKKLSYQDVTEIRQRFARGGVTRRALANAYGVTSQYIGSIILGKSWAQ